MAATCLSVVVTYVCVLFVVCLVRQALCSSCCPRTHRADQGGFVSALLGAGIEGVYHQAGLEILKIFFFLRQGLTFFAGLISCNLALNSRDNLPLSPIIPS